MVGADLHIVISLLQRGAARVVRLDDQGCEEVVPIRVDGLHLSLREYRLRSHGVERQPSRSNLDKLSTGRRNDSSFKVIHVAEGTAPGRGLVVLGFLFRSAAGDACETIIRVTHRH